MSIMADVDLEPLERGVSRRHIASAFLAAALSTALHAVLLYWLAGVQFDVPIVTEVIERVDLRRKMHVTSVTRETKRVEAPPDIVGAGIAGTTVDLAREVEALAARPDEVLLEPPVAEVEGLDVETRNVAAPSPMPEQTKWEPRQEIVDIRETIVKTEKPNFERRRVVRVQRVPNAPDLVLPIDSDRVKPVRTAPPSTGMAGRPSPASIVQDQRATVEQPAPAVAVDETKVKEASERIVEKPEEVVTEVKPIEDVLSAEITTYLSTRDPDNLYFRVGITRAGAEVLPVLPKDIVFMQDCSASMAEQRLHFCRQGLLDALAELRPGDRFNVIGFRDSAQFCFPKWVSVDKKAIKQAQGFIQAMTSTGETDIFSSIKVLSELKRDPARPLVAVLITDGLATTGLTRSSEIIGRFAKLNQGRTSVFAIGTMAQANSYLLDFLSYSNRGEGHVVESGRWGIPEAIAGITRSVSRPLLSDVEFQFGADSKCEVYPVTTANLYLDRPLVVYGRCPKDSPRVAFQAVGQAGDFTCDMVFDLNLAEGQPTRDETIREQWARQKLYHYIAKYTANPSREIYRVIRTTANRHHIDVPYKGRF